MWYCAIGWLTLSHKRTIEITRGCRFHRQTGLLCSALMSEVIGTNPTRNSVIISYVRLWLLTYFIIRTDAFDSHRDGKFEVLLERLKSAQIAQPCHDCRMPTLQVLVRI